MPPLAGVGGAHRSYLLILLLFLSLFCLPCAFADEPLSIELPESVACDRDFFYLGEYAAIEGDFLASSHASMARVSTRGGFVTSEAIGRALAGRGLSGQSARLKIPDRVRVIPESEITRALRLATGWRWRIDVLDEQKAEGVSFSLPRSFKPGSRTVPIRVKLPDGRVTGRNVRVTWYQPAVFTLDSLQKGHILKEGDLVLRVTDASPNDSFFTSPQRLAGKELRKSLEGQTAVDADDLARKVLVRSGSKVTLEANVRGIAIVVEAVALESGDLGDLIRVRNAKTRQIVSAKIVSAGKVRAANADDLNRTDQGGIDDADP